MGKINFKIIKKSKNLLDVLAGICNDTTLKIISTRAVIVSSVNVPIIHS